MNETPETNNRLRNAVNSVAVPPDLEAQIRGQLRAEQLASEADDRLRGAVESVPVLPVPPFLAARIRNRIRGE